jgi:hypothetical protein
MIKTLRITSFLAAILAITFFVTLVVYGVNKDEDIEKYLNFPDVITQFKTAKGNLAKSNDNQISPLVQQAQTFSSILNPPKPKETARTRAGGRSKPNVAAEPNVKPKFIVKGTSYFKSNPELSMVLIDEPGKGSHWVKQSTMVGHLLIEDVKDGIVVVKSSEGTYELKIEEKIIKNTTSRPSSVPNRSTPTRPNRNTTSSSTRPPVINPTPKQGRRTTTPTGRSQPTKIDSDKSAELEDLAEKLKALQRSDSGSDQSNAEKVALVEQLINNYRNSNTNISEKEAEKLDVLGDMLMRENTK